jgi:hypothetical protein
MNVLFVFNISWLIVGFGISTCVSRTHLMGIDKINTSTMAHGDTCAEPVWSPC